MFKFVSLLMLLISMILLGLTGASKAEAASYPSCSKVWVKGHTLPKNYKGCTKGAVIWVPVWVKCDNGTRLTSHNDRLWAKAGKKIKGQDSYDKAFWECVD